MRRAAGDKLGIAKAVGNLGVIAMVLEDYATARAAHAESVALHRELGDKPGSAEALINLANVAVTQEDYPAARASLEESLALSRDLDYKFGINTSLETRLLGVVQHLLEDLGGELYALERSLYDEAAALARQGLGDAAFARAVAAGQALAEDDAIAQALAG
ncbi:MAG TPA: tetratricopeptide repeat protein [Chloroflexia bacterium]|nr:tetratricopeptide repeat protein [Chloroflexia bacterium]